jgi:predicted SAM-dependent methyltransferase
MSLKLCLDQMVAGKSGAVDLKLHLGCGANILPGWINTDTMPSPVADYLDSTKNFPFTDSSFVAVFCEHMIEHMEKPQARSLLQEVFRVLRPKGVFRLVTPSFESFARLALDPSSAPAQKYLANFRQLVSNPRADLGDAINLIFYGHGHRHVYLVEELATILRQAGFSEARVMAAGTYGDAIFNGVDGHGKIVGEELNAIESFAVEARK